MLPRQRVEAAGRDDELGDDRGDGRADQADDAQPAHRHIQLEDAVVVVGAADRLVAKLDYLRDFVKLRVVVIRNVPVAIHRIVE